MQQWASKMATKCLLLVECMHHCLFVCSHAGFAARDSKWARCKSLTACGVHASSPFHELTRRLCFEGQQVGAMATNHSPLVK
eukprot:1154019-Pelagomonas_calceolata.AAC.3